MTNVYKGKGSKSDLDNHRGLFILNTIRTIKDKMLHSDIYDTIHESMSDSQVGATKGRSIRNHLFILNTMINEVKQA